MNSKKYWEKRKAQNMFEYMQGAEDTAEQISKAYLKSLRYLDEQTKGIYDKYKQRKGLSDREAKRLFDKLENKTVEELKKELAKTPNNKDKQELLQLLDSSAYKARLERLNGVRKQIDGLAKDLYGVEFNKSTEFYKKLANESYLHGMFDIQQQVGYGFELTSLDRKVVDKVLKSKWSGNNYSENIWNNTEELAQKLKEELLVNLMTGRTEREVSKAIQDRFVVSAYKARRIVRTESCYIANEMEMQSYKECGIEKYEFLATLDLRTSEPCQKLDGKKFEVGKGVAGVNMPPMHPFCRSTTVAVFDDEVEEGLERRARNPETGKTELVPADMTYEDWKKGFVVNDNSDKEYYLKNIIDKEPIKSLAKWNNYISEIDENLINEVHTNLNKTMIEQHVEEVCIIKKGENEPIYQKGKDIDEVIVSKENLAKLKNSPINTIVFAHVHPSKTSFSKSDLRFLVNYASISNLTLECIDGTKYIMQRGIYKSTFINKFTFDNLYVKVYNDIALNYPNLNDPEKIYDIWDKFVFDVNKSIAEKLGMIFKEIKNE